MKSKPNKFREHGGSHLGFTATSRKQVQLLLTMKKTISVALLCVVALFTGCSKFEDPTLDEAYTAGPNNTPPERSPVEHNPNRHLLWGDLHVHTAFSYDAFTMGTRALPDDAYTIMKGGVIQHGLGYPIQADRPLDFGAVTDHAEYLGIPRHLAGEKADKPDESLCWAAVGTRAWPDLGMQSLKVGANTFINIRNDSTPSQPSLAE